MFAECKWTDVYNRGSGPERSLRGCRPARWRRDARLCRGAFTLLELLAAVAIIALLIGLLLPALGRARESGRSVHCAGILHNAGIAMTLYLDDNEDTFWPYKVDVTGPDGGRRWWFGFEPGGPAFDPWQKHRPLDKTRGFLSKYLTGSDEDLLCPGFPYGDGLYFPKFSPNAGGYGYNTGALGGLNWIDPTVGAGRRVQEFDGRASEVFALADGIHFDRLDFSGDGMLNQPFNEPPYIQWQEPAFFGRNLGVNGGYGHFRHNGRANVLFLDAHAASQPVRRPLHPYSEKGYGPVSNLTDDTLAVREIEKGNLILKVDLIYGLN